jgi:O-succinylbenzoic acid--CoA ligase
MSLPSAQSLLQDRWGHPWLVGVDNLTFWRRLDQWCQVLEPCAPGAVLISEPDPRRMWLIFLAAQRVGCSVVLGNPQWGDGEWQPLRTSLNLVDPQPLVPGVGCYLCQVPLPQEPPRILIATGGSSGQIKFAIHTWSTLMASVQGFCQHFQTDRVNAYCVLPLYHVSGLMQGLRVLATGGQLVMQSYRALKGVELLPLAAPKFLSLVPTQLQELMAQGEPYLAWLRRFQAVLLGGAPPWPALLHRARTQGVPLAPTYGMTETASQVATLLPQAFLAGCNSSGQVLPHATIQMVDSQGLPLPPGQVGTILIEAESLAQGYFWDTGEVTWHSGPWRTDDVGYLDAAGQLQVVGRQSTKLITGGENVFPEEVEAALLATGQVDEACVVGLPCDRWGQRLCALVVLAPAIPLGELRNQLRPRLAAYKQPKDWIMVEALPKTAQGKLSRPQALALALALCPHSAKHTKSAEAGAKG